MEAHAPAIDGFVEYGFGSARSLVQAQSRPYSRSVFSHQVQASGYVTSEGTARTRRTSRRLRAQQTQADSGPVQGWAAVCGSPDTRRSGSRPNHPGKSRERQDQSAAERSVRCSGSALSDGQQSLHIWRGSRHRHGRRNFGEQGKPDFDCIGWKDVSGCRPFASPDERSENGRGPGSLFRWRR